MPRLTILIGPPGSGKSTLAKTIVDANPDTIYINQDTQGKEHLDIFKRAAAEFKDIVVDRMNFNKQQRQRYLEVVKDTGYHTKAIVLCESKQTCLDRMRSRVGHPTITEEVHAQAALKTFFTMYEPPQYEEGIEAIERVYPAGDKPACIVVDLDGTLCDVEHRRHFVRPTDGSKKNWAGFFKGIKDDEINKWCKELVERFATTHRIVFCSGRDDNHRNVTVDWLYWKLGWSDHANYDLYMRHRNDSRQDYLVKEILLDFEILTRYTPMFMVDDRQQVVDMWRKRGFVCLQCDEGDF